MKTTVLALAGLLALGSSPLSAIPALVIGLEAGVNVQGTITATGIETVGGTVADPTYQARFVVVRSNTHDFIGYLDEKYDLITGPTLDWKLVAVIAGTGEGDAEYRFYLKKDGQTPVLVPSYAIVITPLAKAFSYNEIYSGDVLTAGGGGFKYAVTLTGSGMNTTGIAKGTYRVRAVTLEGETHTVIIPGAMQISAAGTFTKDENTYVLETRWVFTASRPVNIAGYPVPEPPPAE